MRNRKSMMLLSGAVLCALLGATPLFAQEDGADLVEEVLVTGSRIRRNVLDEPAPVMEVSNEVLENTGLTNLGQILQAMPITGSAINSRDNVPGNSGFPQDGTGIGAGATQVSLRNLGAKRTLVLVDGKRWVAGASASGVPTAVDMNTIPANAIKRIEILQDGASAIYGSDAIGGVVNVITNRDFEGLKIDLSSGSFLSEGDGENNEAAVLFGGGSDSTHFTVSASYTKEGGVFTSDRPVSAFPTAFATSCEAGGCSSFTPQGRFILGPNFGFTDVTLNTGVLNNGTTSIPVFDPANPFAGDFNAFDASDRYNYNGNQFNYIKTPNERVNLYADVQHELTSSTNLNLRAVYTNRQSSTSAAPEPLCLGNGCGNRIMDNILISAANPFNPFGVDLSVANGNLEFFGRRPLESGPRLFDQDVDTYFVSAGFDGEFAWNNNDYFWDFTGSYGDNQGFQQKQNSHNAARIAVALGDPAVCAATPGCVPLNLFGGQGPDGTGSFTQEMLDFITYTQRDFSEQTLKNYAGNISSEFYSLPAGEMAFAAGFEYRDHEGSFQPDPIAERGETAGIPSGATNGAFHVFEYYGELSVPLLAGRPGADYLELNVALRNSDYSNFGNESTYKLGALYRPIPSLSLRGSISTGIRAPGIGELFGGAARSDFTFLDPCADVLGVIDIANGGRDDPATAGPDPQSATIQANCASLGVPTDLAQRNSQLSAISGGNSNLNAETSDNLSLGLVYKPEWLGGLSTTLDYYDIEIDDAVQGRSPGDVISGCVDTLDSSLCDLVSRSANGVINLVDNQLQNIGQIEASGLDIGLTYDFDLSYGQFRARLDATHLLDYKETTFNIDGTASTNDLTGRITDETFQRAFPEWRVTTGLDWMRDRWGGGLTLRSSSAVEQPSGNDLDSRTFADLRVSYNPGWYDNNLTITAGFNNVFDKDPATCEIFVCGTTSISGVLHDIPGRYGYIRLSLLKETE